MLGVTLALKAVGVLAVATFAGVLAHRASASIRATIWTTALTAILALPLLSAIVPAVAVPVLPAPGTAAVTTFDGLAGGTRAANDSTAAAHSYGERHALTEPALAVAHAGPLAYANGAKRTDRGGAAGPVPPGAARPIFEPRRTVAAADHQASVSGPTARWDWLRAEAARFDGLASSARTTLQGILAGVSRVATQSVALRVGGFLWSLGTALLLAHLALGIARVIAIRRSARPCDDPALQRRAADACQALGVRGDIAIMESDDVQVPMIWHLTRPYVLIPRAMRSWNRERQRVVLLHELAHVRRNDGRTQLLAHLAVALHWFNPLAWLALRELLQTREQACDDAVLRVGVRPSAYAQHLVDIANTARQRRGPVLAPGVAFARRTRLGNRVQAILDPSAERTSPTRSTTVSVVSVALALLLPVAAFQPVSAQTPAVDELPLPTISSDPEAARAPVAPADSTPVTDDAGSPPARAPHGSAAAAPQASQTPSLDQLVKMRIHGITPEYIEGVTDMLGRRPDIDDLVKMRIHGVTPEYAREMKAALGDLTLEDLTTGRIHGVSPEFAANMADLLGERLDFDDLVKMRIHGVTTGFVQDATDMLGQQPDLDELVKMRIHGVSGDYARQMRDAFGDMDVDDLTQGRIHGLTAEYARAMRSEFGDIGFKELIQGRIHGLSDEYARAMRTSYSGLEFKDLIQARIHGMSPEFASRLSSTLGNDSLAFRDLIQARIHGLSPEFAEEMQQLLPNETIGMKDFVQMRIHGVSTKLVRDLQAAGYDDLTVDDLVKIRIHGMERVMLRRNGGQ